MKFHWTLALVRKWEITRGKEKSFDLGGNRTQDLRISLSVALLSCEARREQVVGDYGSNYGNVNVKSANKCCAACTKDTNEWLEN